MKRFLIFLVVPVVVLGVLAILRIRPERPRTTPRPRVEAREVETQRPPEPTNAPDPIRPRVEEPIKVVRAGLPAVPQESKARALLRKIDWKRTGEQQLAMENGKKEWDSKDAAGQMKSAAAWMELMAFWMEHPEEKEAIGREIAILSTEGYLAALGISLADDQQGRLRGFFETQPPDLSSLDWFETDKKDYDILRSMEQGLRQEIATDGALAGILTGAQREVYLAGRPPDPSSVGFWRDEIEAASPQEAADKVTAQWMKSLKIPEESRSSVLAAAQSYYAMFQNLHQGYDHADRNRRAEIWIATVQALQKARDDLKDLIPEEGRDGMAWMQIPTFSR